jgi:hypothetical protein
MTAFLPLRQIEANAVRLISLIEGVGQPLARQPRALSLIEPLPPLALSDDGRIVRAPRGLKPYPSMEALADRVTQLLAGRGYWLKTGFGGLPLMDTFPLVNVYASSERKADAEWLCAAILLDSAGRRADLDRLETALAQAMRRWG